MIMTTLAPSTMTTSGWEETTNITVSTSEPEQLENMVTDPVLSVVGFWVGLLINAVGIFGNILVIAAIRISKQLRTGPQMFIVSLAASDLATILLSNLLQLEVLRTHAPLGQSACSVQNVAFVQLNLTSVFHIAVIAVYRGFAAVSPRRYKIIQRKRIIALVLVPGSS